MSDPVEYERERDETTMTALLWWCENMLGWLPPRDPEVPAWQLRQRELAKLKSTMRRTRVDLEQMWRVARWCLRHRRPIDAPSYLAYLVDELGEEIEQERELDDLDAAIAAAIETEHAERSPGWSDRVGRFMRTRGVESRSRVYREWKEARDG